MLETDYYKQIGVSRGASLDEIKSALRKEFKKYHPDLNSHETSHDDMIRLNKIKATLTDVEKRKAYNITLLQSMGKGKRFEGKATSNHTKTTASRPSAKRKASALYKSYLILFTVLLLVFALSQDLKYSHMFENIMAIFTFDQSPTNQLRLNDVESQQLQDKRDEKAKIDAALKQIEARVTAEAALAKAEARRQADYALEKEKAEAQIKAADAKAKREDNIKRDAAWEKYKANHLYAWGVVYRERCGGNQNRGQGYQQYKRSKDRCFREGAIERRRIKEKLDLKRKEFDEKWENER